MVRRKQEPTRTGRTILLIDDSEEYLQSARRIIERDGHDVIAVGGALEGLAVLAERDVDLVLVDYLMPGLTGEDFVKRMRPGRPTTQVILQTGYASEHPPRELLRRLDIQGFHDKSDGPEKLALWVDVGLRAAFTVQLLTKSREGLRFVLDATPALHRIQPLDDLLQGILMQTTGLLGATDSFVASVPQGHADHERDGFVALARDGEDLRIRAATGRFRIAQRVGDGLDAARMNQLLAAARTGTIARVDGATIAPLRVGARSIGVVYVDRSTLDGWEVELVEVFANQAAVAIQNVALYEMAALDSLTGASTRRFFDLALDREIRGCWRSGEPLGALLVDVDGMKTINDQRGHGAGDAALSALGQCLRQSLRLTDTVGRIGGDEFAVILPATDAEGTAVVAGRLRERLSCLMTVHDGQPLRVRASVGAAVLTKRTSPHHSHLTGVEAVAKALLAAGDAAMYAAKRSRDDAQLVRCIDWSNQPTSEAAPAAEPTAAGPAAA